MMTKSLHQNSAAPKALVHVDSLEHMGRRFVDAWHRVEAGEPVDEAHVTFLDLETMLSTLSPRRLQLLRQVHRQSVDSTRDLAAALGRDYKNVHQDVAALEAVGLLVRDGRKLAAPWEEVQASVSLAA